jgi:hypothetical protein
MATSATGIAPASAPVSPERIAATAAHLSATGSGDRQDLRGADRMPEGDAIGKGAEDAAAQGSGPPERSRRARLCLVGSSGGHLVQLHALEPVWRAHDRAWVTFDTPDARSLLARERTYWAHHPTNRNLPNLLRNFAVAWRVLRAERPTVLVSSGAGVAIPFFVLGRLFGAKLVYLEVYDRIDSATLSGRACRPFAHVFALQWEEQKRVYPRGTVVGPVL